MKDRDTMFLQEVADLLRVHRHTLRRWIVERGIPHTKHGERGHYRFSRAAVTAWLKGKQPGAAGGKGK